MTDVEINCKCAELVGMKPPSQINGKSNPAYLKWWRKKNPDKYRVLHDRAEAVKAKRYRESNKRTHPDECKCVECGMIFKRSDAHIRGFRFMGRYNCICDECTPRALMDLLCKTNDLD